MDSRHLNGVRPTGKTSRGEIPRERGDETPNHPQQTFCCSTSKARSRHRHGTTRVWWPYLHSTVSGRCCSRVPVPFTNFEVRLPQIEHLTVIRANQPSSVSPREERAFSCFHFCFPGPAVLPKR